MKEFSIKRIIAVIAITVLQLLLIILKTLNVVDLDWGWVFAPLWIPYLACIFGMSIIIIYVVLANGIERIKNGRLARREKSGR